VVYTEAFGAAAYIGRARVVPLRNMGAVIVAFMDPEEVLQLVDNPAVGELAKDVKQRLERVRDAIV